MEGLRVERRGRNRELSLEGLKIMELGWEGATRGSCGTSSFVEEGCVCVSVCVYVTGG